MYTYLIVRSRRGRPRLLEVPCPDLKRRQGRALRRVLAALPQHPAAHGFRRGRSVATFAMPHCGQAVVIRCDLRDHFASTTEGMVASALRRAGLYETRSESLAALCTTSTPAEAFPAWWPDRSRVVALYGVPHLPTGASTSPALSDCCAWQLDESLTALARELGAAYTRYGDDMALSGDVGLGEDANRVMTRVREAVASTGYSLSESKTRIMRRSGRQQLCGAVVNEYVNCSRAEYATLRAVLCNCIRYGPASQNRYGVSDYHAHLLGRVTAVNGLNRVWGARLLALFNRIDWRET